MECTSPVIISGVKFNCGKCPNCRKMKTIELTMRLFHESKYHENSVFVTFTYDDEHLPVNGQGLPTLRKSDFVAFMKRLRKAYFPKKLRVFYCGEYGGITNRPHYHAILFGASVEDEDLIRKKWNNGFVTIANLTLGRCRYVAKYILKNEVFSYDYCTEHCIEPQFVQSSNRPGIGYQYVKDNFLKFSQDLKMQFRGKDVPLPRYYYLKLKEYDEFIPYRMYLKNLSWMIKSLKLDPLKPLYKDPKFEFRRLKQLELNIKAKMKVKGL